MSTPTQLTDLPLAWEYLLPERPMIRRIDTLEVHSARWVLHRMELDVSFPQMITAEWADYSQATRCYIPVGFFPKHPTASDLEVHNGAGDLIAVPTKRQNMALTEQAIRQISKLAAKFLGKPPADYALDGDLLTRVAEVIEGEPLDARIIRLEIANEMIPATDVGKRAWLLPLLNRFEDHFMLWAPIEGQPSAAHHLSVRRSGVREVDPIFPQSRRDSVEVIVPSKAGNVVGHWNPPSWRRSFDPAAAIGRLLIAFGLMPVKYEEEALEASRFSSYHLCMIPPAGLLVREVKAGRIPEEQWGSSEPDIRELESDVDRTVQGRDTQTGHVHLTMNPNPRRLNSRVTIGLRPGTTTLWALVAVLSCGLLWAFHQEVRHLLGFSTHLVGHRAHPLAWKLEVAAAVLLVGPTFAAAWTLRERDGTLMRSMLAGTRLLLLGEAILSVGTALALAGLRPFSWGPAEAIGWYASISYTIAALVVIGWVQTRSVTWFIYRHLLTKTAWSLLATAVFTMCSYVAIGKLANFPAVSTLVLLGCGLGLAAIAGNRTAVPLGKSDPWPALLAGIGAFVTLALASRELNLYSRLVDRGVAHKYGVYLELTLATVALVMLLLRLVQGRAAPDVPPADVQMEVA